MILLAREVFAPVPDCGFFRKNGGTHFPRWRSTSQVGPILEIRAITAFGPSPLGLSLVPQALTPRYCHRRSSSPEGTVSNWAGRVVPSSQSNHQTNGSDFEDSKTHNAFQQMCLVAHGFTFSAFRRSVCKIAHQQFQGCSSATTRLRPSCNAIPAGHLSSSTSLRQFGLEL